MKKILKKMNVLLDGKQKAKMGGIVVLMIIGAALEACSIGLVIPIITTLLDPEAVNGEGYLGDIYRFLGMKSTSQFTIVMLLVIIAAFVVKNVFLYFQNVVQLRFVYTNQFATSRRMMINFMERPYEYYLNADTSVIQRSITSDVNNMYGLILYVSRSGHRADDTGSHDDSDDSPAPGDRASGYQMYFEAYHDKGGRG